MHTVLWVTGSGGLGEGVVVVVAGGGELIIKGIALVSDTALQKVFTGSSKVSRGRTEKIRLFGF